MRGRSIRNDKVQLGASLLFGLLVSGLLDAQNGVCGVRGADAKAGECKTGTRADLKTETRTLGD